MEWFKRKKERPDAADGATRAIILKYIVVYSFATPPLDSLEQVVAGWAESEREKFVADAETRRDEYWSKLGSLRKEMSPLETKFSLTTMNTMSESQRMNASWRGEGLTVLLWALGIVVELPPYDTEAVQELFGGFAPDDTERFIKNAQLLPTDVINKARDTAELWHWRSRTKQIIEDGEPFPTSPQMKAAGFTSYDSIVRATAKHAVADGTISNSIDDDFLAFGKPYRDLTAEEWSKIRSITMERHFALNWLCGYAPDNRWDETPTET